MRAGKNRKYWDWRCGELRLDVRKAVYNHRGSCAWPFQGGTTLCISSVPFVHRIRTLIMSWSFLVNLSSCKPPCTTGIILEFMISLYSCLFYSLGGVHAWPFMECQFMSIDGVNWLSMRVCLYAMYNQMSWFGSDCYVARIFCQYYIVQNVRLG